MFSLGVSLNGSVSRYRDGTLVSVVGVSGSFKVSASAVLRTDSNIYTVIYKLLRDVGNGVFSEVHFVPESLVFTQSESSGS